MWKQRTALKDSWEELIEFTSRPRAFLIHHAKLVFGVLGVVAIIFLVLRYSPWVLLPWGFNGKSWWDVLELLGVPLALALTALCFNSAEKKRGENAVEERRQDEILTAYFDRMGELLIDKGLLEEQDQMKTPVGDYARVITITALRSVDKDRRNSVLQFLRDAKLSGFLLRASSLDHTNMTGANLWDFDLSGSRLPNAVLDKANLNRAILNDCFLEGASLKDVNLQSAEVQATVLANCDLRGSYFGGANLTTSNLEGADLRASNFYHAILAGAIFSSDENHLYADLRGASFVRAELPGAHLSGVKLSGADFTRAKLTGANLVLTDVRGVHFSWADLSQAAFTGAKGLTEKQLASAILYQTRMPSGILRSNQPETAKATA